MTTYPSTGEARVMVPTGNNEVVDMRMPPTWPAIPAPRTKLTMTSESKKGVTRLLIKATSTFNGAAFGNSYAPSGATIQSIGDVQTDVTSHLVITLPPICKAVIGATDEIGWTSLIYEQIRLLLACALKERSVTGSATSADVLPIDSPIVRALQGMPLFDPSTSVFGQTGAVA